MSYDLITAQGFESDNTPFTLTGTMARSTTSPLAGTYSLRGGNGLAVDGAATWTLPAASRPSTGSRKGLRLQIWFKFKIAAAPAGGNISVLDLYDGGGVIKGGLGILGGTTVLRYNSVAGSTAMTTARSIYIDYREEKASGGYVQIYVDGALEITRRAVGEQLGILGKLVLGVAASGKCTWDGRWDDMTVKVAYDPQ